MAFTYILECADGTYYTGSAKDIEKRIASHSAGKGAKYTAGRRPVTLLYQEEYESFGDALRREKQIKKMSREEKKRLIFGTTK